MKISIKNRIALYSVIGIASLSLVVFIAIFFSVRNHTKGQIDEKLEFEAEKHIYELNVTKDSIFFVYKDEWLEREHLEIEVFPLFVEIFDVKGKPFDKSPNLLNNHLDVQLARQDKFIVNYTMNEILVRQIQMPLEYSGKVVGYLAIATSFEDAQLVLNSLLTMLLIIYPLLIVITFFTSRFISTITIRPITKIANRVSAIHSGNLDSRLEIEENGDELETLSRVINDFLDRIDEALKREKQFTADASHQLRTPLAAMKGNLQVLLRKKRSESEYKEEINQAIFKIDDMTDAVEKLLILARLNTTNRKLNFEDIQLYPFIENIFNDYKKPIISKGLTIKIDENLKTKTVYTKRRFLQLIIDNLISNAIKYAFTDSIIRISSKQTEDEFSIIVENNGPEIPQQDLEDIFIPFFRNMDHNISEKGYGLGLAIVKKASEALKLRIQVHSEKKFTQFKVIFNPDMH